MATCYSTHGPVVSSSEELHRLRQMLQGDPALAQALRSINTTEDAGRLVSEHGLAVTPEALWRNRGTLISGGRPTWRGEAVRGALHPLSIWTNDRRVVVQFF